MYIENNTVKHYGSLQITYEELKPRSYRDNQGIQNSLQITYEELKHMPDGSILTVPNEFIDYL